MFHINILYIYRYYIHIYCVIDIILLYIVKKCQKNVMHLKNVKYFISIHYDTHVI